MLTLIITLFVLLCWTKKFIKSSEKALKKFRKGSEIPVEYDLARTGIMTTRWHAKIMQKAMQEATYEVMQEAMHFPCN